MSAPVCACRWVERFNSGSGGKFRVADECAVHGCESEEHAPGMVSDAAILFQCSRCDRSVCTDCEGTTDRPDLCDECWVDDSFRGELAHQVEAAR